MNRPSSKFIHYYTHLFVLCLFVVGIVCSKFLMSMGILLGIISLLIEGDFKAYYTNLKANRFFLAVLVFYGIHIFGMFWTEDIIEGLSDLKSKLTLVIVPLIVISRPLVLRKSYKAIISVFVLSLIITSMINFISYHFYSSDFNFKDARDMSLFNSHIRFAIMIAFGLPLLYDLSRDNKKTRYLFIIPAIWFLYYTFVSQVLTGVVCLGAIFMTLLIFPLWLNKKYISLLFLSFSGIIICSLIFIGLKSTIVNEALPSVDNESVKSAWQIRSKLSYDGKDNRNQALKYTLSRFLISKNYSMTGSGVDKLTKEEVRSIEKGMAHYSEMEGGFRGRIEGIRYQLSHMSDPNGHSLLQRIEAWKVGASIFWSEPILGVGTGDLISSFKLKYKELQTKLTPKNQIRAHNTYLTSLITFGLIGLLSFLLLLFSSGIIQLQQKQLIGFIFLVIMMVTFFFEDTLETQTGITLFAFFSALFSLPIPGPSTD